MSEETTETESPEDIADREERRHANIYLIIEEYMTSAAHMKAAVFERSSRLEDLQKQIDELMAKMRDEDQTWAREWNHAMSDLALPVADGEVVPYTKSRTPDELILALDRNEWLVVQGQTIHHYAPDAKKEGRWICKRCHHATHFEAVDIAVRPTKLPSSIGGAVS